MRKSSILVGIFTVIGMLLLTGCNMAPVSVDTQKEIQNKIEEVGLDLTTIPVSHIKESTRASISVETNTDKEEKGITFIGTDIVKYEEQEILISYVSSNVQRDEWKSEYKHPIANTTFFTNEHGQILYWEKDGWYFELKTADNIPSQIRMDWAKTFAVDKNLPFLLNDWLLFRDMNIIQHLPGENIEFNIGLSAKNPNQSFVTKIPNAFYVNIHTDMIGIKGYQMTHSAVPKEEFDYSLVDSMDVKIQSDDIKLWYSQEEKLMFWEDDQFVYHLQDNVTKQNVDLFGIEDYKKFVNIKF